MALAIERILRESDFYNFLLRYKQTQIRMSEASLRGSKSSSRTA